MKEYKIEDYLDDLKKFCEVCKTSKRCKDKDKICVFKKSVFTLGKFMLKRREKVGVKDECSSNSISSDS